MVNKMDTFLGEVGFQGWSKVEYWMMRDVGPRMEEEALPCAAAWKVVANHCRTTQLVSNECFPVPGEVKDQPHFQG